MSTSSVNQSSESGQLSLTSQTPGTQFAVVDSALRPVETTSSWRDQVVAAGVYLVEGRVGATARSRVVSVPPGGNVSEDLTVQIPAAAPTYGARTTNETHADLASGLSSELASGAGPDAGLVLVLRNLRGSDPGTLHRDDIEILDHSFARVSQWPSDWVDDPYGGATARAARLEPGPYVLRTTRRSRGRSERADQTIWLAPGWQTLVFVPNTAYGPDPRGLSVHMTGLGRRWQFDEFESRAVESALAGLRDNATSIDRQTAEILLYGKFQNPMLGIIGLHALLLFGRASDALAHQVVHNLTALLGEHPDVIALATRLSDWPGGGNVSWPPMLERSYRSCLLPADRQHPGTLVDGSLAESVAPLIRIPGPWLRWTVEENAPTGSRAHGGSEGLVSADEASAATDDIRWAGIDSALHGGAPSPPSPPVGSPAYASAAVNLVKSAVDEISAFHEVPAAEVVALIGVAELAARTGLTASLVSDSLHHLGLDR